MQTIYHTTIRNELFPHLSYHTFIQNVIVLQKRDFCLFALVTSNFPLQRQL